MTIPLCVLYFSTPECTCTGPGTASCPNAVCVLVPPQAKAQLEETFRMTLEEKDEKINVMQTQVLYIHVHVQYIVHVRTHAHVHCKCILTSFKRGAKFY